MSLRSYFVTRKRSLEGCQAEEPAGKKARDYVEEFIAGTCDTDKVSDNPEEPLTSRNSDTLTAGSSETEAGTSSSNTKQAVAFSKKWLKNRNWLEYIKGKGMFCKLCRKYNNSIQSSYGQHDVWNTIPCTRLRLQSITGHENSSGHRQSVKLELSVRSSQNIASIVNPVVPKRGIEQAFACLYFLTKQRIPHTTNFEPLLDFFEFMGLHVKSNLHVARNATYTSFRSIQEMVFIMSEVIEKKILNRLRESDHFALMFDETTDCSVTEQLAIHVRFIDKESGSLKTCYLKIIDVLQPEIDALGDTHVESTSCVSVCAHTITNRIHEFIEEAQLDITKLRGIGTDGASTMIGCHNGVVARLNRNAPSAIGVHCAAHRLNLASSQAGDTVPYVKKFNNILRQLFDFFENSVFVLQVYKQLKN